MNKDIEEIRRRLLSEQSKMYDLYSIAQAQKERVIALQKILHQMQRLDIMEQQAKAPSKRRRALTKQELRYIKEQYELAQKHKGTKIDHRI